METDGYEVQVEDSTSSLGPSEGDSSASDVQPIQDTLDGFEMQEGPLESFDDSFGGFGDDDLFSGLLGEDNSVVTGDSGPGSPVVIIQQNSEPQQETFTLDGIETFALSPIQSSTGLKGILLDVLGPYDNIITQYRYQSNTSSNWTYVNETTPDYPWIASAALFIALVVSCFSLLRRALWMK